MNLPPIWDVTTHYALEDVRKAAETVSAAPDTDAAKRALCTLRTAAMKAYAAIGAAEREARRAALANVRSFA